jgi:hypothetical protein
LQAHDLPSGRGGRKILRLSLLSGALWRRALSHMRATFSTSPLGLNIGPEAATLLPCSWGYFKVCSSNYASDQLTANQLVEEKSTQQKSLALSSMFSLYTHGQAQCSGFV